VGLLLDEVLPVREAEAHYGLAGLAEHPDAHETINLLVVFFRDWNWELYA
jgi:hypothetical protein